MKFSDLLGSFKSDKAGQSHIKNLIEMAAADGQFLDSEKTLLKSIAKRNGISESQLTDIQNNPSQFASEMPQDGKQKFHQLYDLVQMMCVDNQVHIKEKELAGLFAIKFGYKREVAGELVDMIHQNIRNGSTADETLKRAQMMIA